MGSQKAGQNFSMIDIVTTYIHENEKKKCLIICDFFYGETIILTTENMINVICNCCRKKTGHK